ARFVFSAAAPAAYEWAISESAWGSSLAATTVSPARAFSYLTSDNYTLSEIIFLINVTFILPGRSGASHSSV
ncbi:MAG TPA: hypothetical protein VG815_02260, partial [Chloroflexota bacterium]|nr:hypothetical protein [Chloroflexota bacterium]